MEDVLELNVGENEFQHEVIKQCETGGDLGGKNCDPNVEREKFPLDPNDYLTLYEAKKELLERLKEFEEGNGGSTSTIKDTNVVKLPVKYRLGVREKVDDEVELMDCDGPTEIEGTQSTHVEISAENENTDNLKQNNGRRYEKNTNREIPRRPSMDKLRKRLRVKWDNSPEMIGKEIAERLEEPKYYLIINVVKTIGGEKALELFNETKQIQLDGGMHTSNGLRRRTSGGVFLTLLKSKFATEEEVKKIFREDSKVKTEALKRKRALQRQRRRERDRQKSKTEEKAMEEEENTEQTQEC